MPSSSGIAAIHCQGTQEVKIGFVCVNSIKLNTVEEISRLIRPIQFLLIDVLSMRWLHVHPHVAILWICWKQETKSEGIRAEKLAMELVQPCQIRTGKK